jgi:MFS transporter, CP family, cyanate transporter
MFVAALALRPQLAGIGPLLPDIQQSIGVSHGTAGLLNTVPVLCMAIFALPAVRLAHRIGLRAAMAAALAAILAFGAVRPLVDSFALMLLATVGIGAGIGIGGALLPRAVRMALPSRAGFATGVYSGGIQAGAGIAAAVAAPIAIIAGWQVALLVFAGSTGVILVAWLITSRSIPAAEPGDPRPSFPLRSPTAWRLVAIFALNSFCFHSLNTWLPSIYVDLGWLQTSAGGLAAILHLAGLPACFAIPWLSDRSASRHGYLLATCLATAVGIAGILLAPEGAVLWVTVVGLALGAMFPLCLALPIDVVRRPSEVAGHAAMMLTGGYAVAAVGPALVGAMRDVTGSFAAPLAALLAAAVVLCALSVRPITGSGGRR